MIAVNAFDVSVIVEAQHALHVVTLLHTRQAECGMSANLEMNLLRIGIIYMPDNVYLVVHKLICHGEHEAVRILAQRMLCLAEHVRNLVVRMTEETEVHIAGEAVSVQLESAAL